MTSAFSLPSPGDIAEQFDQFVSHYKKHNIHISAVALGPEEYLRLLSLMAKQKVSDLTDGFSVLSLNQFNGYRILVKTEPGMSAILRDNRDVLLLALSR